MTPEKILKDEDRKRLLFLMIFVDSMLDHNATESDIIDRANALRKLCGVVND